MWVRCGCSKAVLSGVWPLAGVEGPRVGGGGRGRKGGIAGMGNFMPTIAFLSPTLGYSPKWGHNPKCG